MANFFPQSTPALRTVNSGGGVIRGPHHIGAQAGRGQLNGFLLTSTRVSYTPELVGPIKKATWEEAPVLNGFRLEVDLEFAMIMADSSQLGNLYGIGLLQAYMNDAMLQSSYAPLQFNLFYANGCQTWRGFYPGTPFAPSPAEGKETTAFSMKIQLKARELIPSMAGIDWAAYQW
jgi:hypothetical protein